MLVFNLPGYSGPNTPIRMITLKDFHSLPLESQEMVQDMENCIRVKYTDPNFPTLQINEKGDWIDLKSSANYTFRAFTYGTIDLGVAMKLPNEYEAILAPRSSTFKKYGVIEPNSIGIIDNSYCGNDDIWLFPVWATRDCEVLKGDRLCQFRLVERMNSLFNSKIRYLHRTPLWIVEVEDLKSENRGGYGTTGR